MDPRVHAGFARTVDSGELGGDISAENREFMHDWDGAIWICWTLAALNYHENLLKIYISVGAFSFPEV